MTPTSLADDQLILLVVVVVSPFPWRMDDVTPDVTADVTPDVTSATAPTVAAASGLLLYQLDEVLADLTWTVPADELGPGLPPTPLPPRRLRDTLLDRRSTYAERDAMWAGIVRRCHADNAPQWRLVAVGLAVPGLLRFPAKCVHSSVDLPDVHADLATGFLIKLAMIRPEGRNIAGRLVYSAIGYAARRYRKHLDRPIAIDVDFAVRPLCPRFGHVDVGLVRVVRAVNAEARCGRASGGLGPDDVRLIGRTRLEHQAVKAVARQLGLGVEAAYKRRQRAEALIARRYYGTGGDPAASTSRSTMDPISPAHSWS
ncbi:MAG: hypothetical protein JXA67_19710 [Micromonosporaceae bacterium]|nr:hypothetical protein [Micromonosporaceae bacterium]